MGRQFSPAAREAWARKEQVTSEIVCKALGGKGVETLKMIGEIYMIAYEEGAHAVLREVTGIILKNFGQEATDGETQNH